MKTLPVTVQVQPLVKASSSKQVKAKFFNMLGIESSTTTNTTSNSLIYNTMECNKKFNHPRDANIVTTVEKLKYNKQDEDLSSPPPKYRRRGSDNIVFRQQRSEETKSVESVSNKVSFEEQVKVLPIPKRDEYSDRVARRIWSSAIEIQEMAMRNSVEFAAEG